MERSLVVRVRNEPQHRLEQGLGGVLGGRAGSDTARLEHNAKDRVSEGKFSLLGFRAYQRDYLRPDVVQLGGRHLPFALGLAGHPIEALDLVG